MSISWSTTRRSISSPSPNSLSAKSYGVRAILNTKLRYCDEQHKILISQLCSSFFCLNVLHVIRIALVYTAPLVFFVLTFFLVIFLPECLQGFSWNGHDPPPIPEPKVFFFVLLWERCTSTQFSRRKSQNCVEKTPVSTATWLQLHQLVLVLLAAGVEITICTSKYYLKDDNSTTFVHRCTWDDGKFICYSLPACVTPQGPAEPSMCSHVRIFLSFFQRISSYPHFSPKREK